MMQFTHLSTLSYFYDRVSSSVLLLHPFYVFSESFYSLEHLLKISISLLVYKREPNVFSYYRQIFYYKTFYQ